MNKINSQLPSRQRGSMYVTLFMLLLLGCVITFALKVAPAYTGNAILKSSMSAIMAKKEFKDMDIAELRSELSKSLRVNSVDGFETTNMKITHEAGKDYADITYEIRNHLAANMSVVVEFNNRFDKN